MNANRLIQVLRWNIIGTKKQILRKVIGTALALLVIILSQCGGAWFSHSETIYGISNAAKFTAFGLGIALLICASKVCWNMATKTDFVNYAMLPATNAEKFTANVIYVTVVRLVQILISVIVADIVQYVVSIIFGCPATSFSWAIIDFISSQNGAWDDTLTFIILALFAHSTYILGGTFFRKHQFLYTSLVCFVVPTALGTLVTTATAGFIHWVEKNDYVVTVDTLISSTAVEYLVIIGLAVLTCLFYYLALRIFNRSQIINNKFFN